MTVFAKVEIGTGSVRARRTSDQAPEPVDGFQWLPMDGRKYPDGPLRWTGRRFVARKVPISAADVLAIRFAELSASDWTALSDREPMPEWAAYRRALRDITAKGSDPKSLIRAFPLRPDGSDPIAHLR